MGTSPSSVRSADDPGPVRAARGHLRPSHSPGSGQPNLRLLSDHHRFSRSPHLARRQAMDVNLHPPDDYSHRFFIWHEWIQVLTISQTPLSRSCSHHLS